MIDLRPGSTWVEKTGDTMTGNLNMTAHIIPSSDSLYDLGSTTLAFRNLYVDTIASITGNALALTPVSGQSLTVNLATTGDFVVNTDDLVVDTSAGNVGIGTTNPNALLSFGTAINAQQVHLYQSGNTRLGFGIQASELRLFADDSGAGGITFGFLSTTDGTTFSEKMRILRGGNVGIGTVSPTNILSLGGNSARTFWMERHTTANTAGNNLTIQAGGATASATDKAGGILVLQGGLSTGTGTSGITLQTSPAGATGTADNAVATMLQITGNQMGFFGVATVVRQTSGANLTNNVTSGGTDDTIANYTDLTTYANDAAAIRNDIYQLARKVKQLNDGLRSYGLFT